MNILVLVFLIIILFLSLFIGNFHGICGAVILGLNAVVLDFLWQWLRVLIIKRAKGNAIFMGILGGMLLRLTSILLFLKFASWWLGNQTFDFYIFVAFLILIPLVNLIEAKKLKLEIESKNGRF
jgi:Na+/proline symporter